jgi:hypothetical protein
MYRIGFSFLQQIPYTTYHYLPQAQYGQNMIEKMPPYETPIMRKLGTVKDLTQGMVCPTSGECLPENPQVPED